MKELESVLDIIVGTDYMNSPYIKKVLKLDENKNISELYFNGVFSSASLFPIIIYHLHTFVLRVKH